MSVIRCGLPVQREKEGDDMLVLYVGLVVLCGILVLLQAIHVARNL